MTNDKGIFIRNIYYMLSYAFQILRQEDYQGVTAEKFDEVHHLFAEILIKGVTRQLKQGLYREYIPMQETLSVMRGKLCIHETISLRVQKRQQLFCEFDEFSENHLYNQILKATMNVLLHVKEVDSQQKQKLKKLLLSFENVDLIPIDSISWNHLTYQRNNRNYELLLNLCYLLLNGMIQTTENGNFQLMSFTEEHMERLYERFVLEYYKKHHPELTPRAIKIQWNLTQQPDRHLLQFLPEMQTDITLQKEEKFLIIDTKYYGKSMIRHYDKIKIRSAHLYQIFAYVQNQDTNHTGNVSGLLLYAKTEEEIFPDFEPFQISGNSIGVKSLDLNREFSEITAQLDEIAEKYFPQK